MKTLTILSPTSRKFYGRIFYGFVLFTWLWRYINHVWLHQLASPVFRLSGIDYGYDAVIATGLPDYVVGNFYVALFFDICILVILIYLFINPRGWVPAIIFTLLYYFYIVCFNSYSLKMTHSQLGILWMSFAFWSQKDNRFSILWQAARYMIIIIYLQAFFYKIIHGSFFNLPQAEAVLRFGIGYSLPTGETGSFTATIIEFILNHKFLMITGYSIIVLLEGLMAIGLFTKKYDRYLFWFPILVHLASFIFLSLSFLEMMIVSLLFYHKKIKAIKTIPVLNDKYTAVAF